MTQGRVVSISITPDAAAPLHIVDAAIAVVGKGLEGDRYFSGGGTYSSHPGEGRHVTLIETEAVEALNAKLGSTFAPGEMRRNVATRGIALNHLVGRDFRVGEVLLRGVRLCEPCAHLESLTREGILKQMLHRCGLRGLTRRELCQPLGCQVLRLGVDHFGRRAVKGDAGHSKVRRQ